MTQWIITSSVLILIIAVLRFALRGKISLKLQYALWGLVLVRLMFPFSVLESPASVLNLVREREEETENPPYYEAYAPETANPPTFEEDIFILDDDIEHIKPDTNIVVDDNGYVTEPEIKVISTEDVLKGIWLTGSALFGAVFAVSNLRFRKKLKNSREYVRGTKAWLPVYESSAVKTPCLFGAVKPTIYVTKEVLADEKVFSHVLEHETTHYRHGDHVWSVLRCFCLAIHWYNPLVWLAAFLSMRDSELACDEDTIKRIGEEERIEYGRTLINLTCEKPAAGILSAATTMTGSKSSIKERIMLIAKKPKMLKITAVLVAVIAVFAVGCTFTGAVVYNPKTAAVEVAESFSNRLEPELTGLDGVIRMTVTAASPEEITTKIYNKSSEEICYSTGYALHFEKDGKWYELKKIKETTDTIFSEVQTKFVSAEYESFWTNVSKESFGKLPDGKYRIIRTVSFGEMDVSENEFYVIAAEFILADGNFVDAGPIINETEFAVSELIYRHSASSVLGFSPIRYEIPEFKWEEFPYTDEEWKNLFFASDAFPFPDISQYEERYYQRLDSLSFIAYLDGELWSVYLSPKKSETPDDLWVWDVYRLVPEEENTEENKALWEFAPALSSGTPWFRFEFDFDFTFINAGVYAGEGQGSLYDIASSENSDALEIKNGDAIRWVPTVDGISGAPSATLNFVVYQNGNPEKHTHTGRIEIKRISSENGKTLYEATLVSETLSLEQNMEFGGGIISIKPEEIPFPETEAMTDEEFFAAAKEMGYSDEQLENLAGWMEEGLTKSHILHPHATSVSVPAAERTADGKYFLGTFFFDPDIYADYGGPIGFAYVRKNGVMKIIPETPSQFTYYGIVDNNHYVFADGNGVRFYEFENTENPSAIWKIPEQENTEYGFRLLDTATQSNVEKAFVCYVDIPEDFDKVYENRVPDLSSTYQIAVLDSEGKLLRNIDTGINLMVEFSGLPDCVRPEIITASEKSVLFKINNLHYVVDYTGENGFAKQYIFTENDVVKYSNIDFESDFAKSAIEAVTDYITENYSANDEIESFYISRVEIDENATAIELNLTGGGVKENYDYEDTLNGFLVVRTIVEVDYIDKEEYDSMDEDAGYDGPRYVKYFVLYDPENKYDRGRMIGNTGWKLIDVSRESFDVPAFDDYRFYIYFEEGKIE